MPCESYEGGALVKDWFTRLAGKEFVPYINISARLPDKPDQGMLRKKGGTGFPYVVILDPGGKVVEGKGGGFRPQSPAQLRKGLKKVQWLLDLEKEAREHPDDPLAVARWVLVDGYRRDHAADLEAMRKAAAVPGVDADLAARFVHFEKTKPIADLWHRYEEKRSVARERRDDAAVKKARAEAMAGIYELYRSGTRLEKTHDKYYTPVLGSRLQRGARGEGPPRCGGLPRHVHEEEGRALSFREKNALATDGAGLDSIVP